MADTQKQIDLLINAKLKGKADLDTTVKSIADLGKAIDDQVALAKKGVGSIDDLRDSYKKLEDAADQLRSAAGLISAFERQTAAITKSEERVAALGARYDALKAKLEAQASVTDKQQASLVKLSATYDRANASLDKQRATLTALEGELRTAGVASDQLGAANERILKAAADTGVALGQVRDAQSTYNADLKAATQIQNDTAAAARKVADAQAAASAAEAKRKTTLDSLTTSSLKFSLALQQANADDTSAAQQKAIELAKGRADATQRIVDAVAKLNYQQQQDKTGSDDAAAKKTADLADARAAATARLVSAVQKLNYEQSQTSADTETANSQKDIELANAKAASYQRLRDTVAQLNQKAQVKIDVQDAGLAKAADDAQKSAAGFTTLARASTDLSPKIVSIKDAIAAIVDPAGQARLTLSGVEDELLKTGAAITGIKGPVQDYQESLRALVTVQKSITGQADLVDNYKAQVLALREARAEFVGARNDVNTYAAAVRAGGDSGAGFVKNLNAAQGAAKSAAVALAAQVQATRDARAALSAAGIDSGKLADAETRLVQASRDGAAATNQLNDAVTRFGVAAGGAAKSHGLFNDESRTSLSLVQRLRGEVLALGAAYTGIQGSINIAAQAIEALGQKQVIQNRLAFVVGDDPTKIGAEYKYLHDQAIYYGVGIDKLADSYSKFSIASKQANLTADQTKFIFEQLTGTMRAQGATSEQQNLVFTQFEQTLGKNKLELQDLKAAANSFIGVEPLMAKGLLALQQPGIGSKNPVGDMLAQITKGTIDGKTALFALATEAKLEYGDKIPASLHTLVAEQGRFQTTIFDLKNAIAEGGFGKAYTDLLGQLTAFFNSDAGNKFAQGLSDKFRIVATVLGLVVENADLVTAALQTLVAIKVVGFVGELAVKFTTLAVTAAAVVPPLTAAQIAVQNIQRAFLLLSIFIGAFEIGTILYEKFKPVRQIGAGLIGLVDLVISSIGILIESALQSIPEFAKDVFAHFFNIIASTVAAASNVFAKFAKAVGADGIAKSLTDIGAAAQTMADQAAAGYSKVGKKNDDLFAKLKANAKRVGDLVEINDPVAAPAAAKGTIEQTPKPAAPKRNTDPSAEEIKKRQTQIEEITKALEGLDVKIDHTDKGVLESQLSAIDSEYAELYRKIKALGGKEAITFKAKLDIDVGVLKDEVRTNFNDTILKQESELQNQIEGIEAAAGKRDKNSLDARLAAIVTAYADTYRKIDALRTTLATNGLSTQPADDDKARADAAIKEQQRIETQKYNLEQLAKAEKALNDLIADRDRLTAAVRSQEEARFVTNEAGTAKINDINASAAGPISAAADAARKLADANKDAFANPAAQLQFIANIDSIAAKAAGAVPEFTKLQKGIQDLTVTAGGAAFDSIAKGIAGAIDKTETWGHAIRNIGTAFLQATAQVLQGLAEQIIKQQILNAVLAISKALGWGGAATGGDGGLSDAIAAGVSHSGGMAGESNRSRVVPTSWFDNAPKYHTGGFAGLAPNEVPAILEKGEQVLSTSDPRNAMNMMKTTAASAAQPVGNRFVLVDDRAKIPEAMNSPEGEKVTLVHLKNNISTVRQMIKG